MNKVSKVLRMSSLSWKLWT